MCSVFQWINLNLIGIFTPVLLFVTGLLFFVILAKFLPKFKSAFKSSESKNIAPNRQSPFSAMCLALAGTLGVGNISGVAAAIIVGGPGTLFWMWFSAVFCSILKFAEILLSIHFRDKNPDGSYSGGAFSYIKKGLNAPKVAAIFCFVTVFTSFTMGNITQVKAASDGVNTAVGIPNIVCGLFFFIFVLLISLGGANKISAFTFRLIPFLCLSYMLCSSLLIFFLRDNLMFVTKMIVSDAFSPRAGMGGFHGVLCSPALRLGVTRGVMSNEAGCGTAPIAHASADTLNPVRQGILGIFEVLFDTVVLCTLTGYAVLLSSVNLSASSTTVVILAFTSVLGEGVKFFLAVSIFLFALASLLGWAFYGQKSLEALGFKKNTIRIYSVVFSAVALMGSIFPESIVWDLADVSISVMALINVFALLFLIPVVVSVTKKFLS